MDFDNQLIEILKLNDNFVDSDGNLINSRIINDALKDDEEVVCSGGMPFPICFCC